jgi:adenosine deaminase
VPELQRPDRQRLRSARRPRYPQLRASGLLATLNTDDPALSDLDLGIEVPLVAAAFGWGWDDMVAIALDGVEACWLDETDKAALRAKINAAATALAPDASHFED